jgi:hypothetical protein
MDRQHFDDLTRALAQGGATRRDAVRLLTGGALASLGVPAMADAKRKVHAGGSGGKKNPSGGCRLPGAKCIIKTKKNDKREKSACKHCCGGRFRQVTGNTGKCCSDNGLSCSTTDWCCLGVCIDGTCQNDVIVLPPAPPLPEQPAPPPPPPPPAQCVNGAKDGNETDVDCGGGSCPRCADNQVCGVENDCRSGTCANSVCVACTPLQLCGSDAGGPCQCHTAEGTGQPVCDNNQPLTFSVNNCAACPLGTETCVAAGATVFNCHKRCGSP